jgi:hypothetical protein
MVSPAEVASAMDVISISTGTVTAPTPDPLLELEMNDSMVFLTISKHDANLILRIIRDWKDDNKNPIFSQAGNANWDLVSFSSLFGIEVTCRFHSKHAAWVLVRVFRID